jgi:hypothetical protein
MVAVLKSPKQDPGKIVVLATMAAADSEATDIRIVICK